MISNRRNTASCFSELARNCSRVTAVRYRRTVRAESSISRNKPFCLSSGIDTNRRSQNRPAPIRIRTLLDSLSAQQIHPAAQSFFQLLLQVTHLKQTNVRVREEFDQKIDIASHVSLPSGIGPEDLNTQHRTRDANRADSVPQSLKRRQMRMRLFHAFSIPVQSAIRNHRSIGTNGLCKAQRAALAEVGFAEGR